MTEGYKTRGGKEEEPVTERGFVLSSLLMNIERAPNNLATKTAIKTLENVYNIPTGAFSGISTYKENVEKDEKKYTVEKRISPTLDELVSEHFTNWRYITKELDKIGPITTKDPREKYEGDIDAVIKKTKNDLAEFEEGVKSELQSLEEKKESGEISEFGYNKGKQLLADAEEIYHILIKELQLKKRGFEFLGEKEIVGRDVTFKNDVKKVNTQIEIEYLPGGGFVVLCEYTHDKIWQENFGDNRNQNFGLADIYSKAKYIVIEGFPTRSLGDSLELRWKQLSHESYERLMKELVKNGFDGNFLELDSRYEGKNSEKTFDATQIGFARNLTYEEAERLFAYIKKINLYLAEEIEIVDRFIEIFRKQRTQGSWESLMGREITEGLAYIKGGTYYHNTASVSVKKEDLNTSSIPTGFELGQMAFSDALSVIKILIMNEAIQKGELEQGLIVDFQGANHRSYKSFFFDNPGYAMEVVLTNMHEILASHPDVTNTEDILDKLENMDEDTWQWVFEFIGKLPFAKIATPTKQHDSVEKGDNQRPMQEIQWYSALSNLSEEQRTTLDGVIDELIGINSR